MVFEQHYFMCLMMTIIDVLVVLVEEKILSEKV